MIQIDLLKRKKCKDCGVIRDKTSVNFPPCTDMADGLRNWCRDCYNRYMFVHRNKDIITTRIYNRAIHARFREKRNLQCRANYYKNRLKYLAWQAADRKKNPERYKKSPEKSRIDALRRRKYVQEADGTFTPHDVRLQMVNQKNTCWWCSKKLTKYHIDHLIPLSKGGSNRADNIVISCPSCNLHKSSKMPCDFAHRLL